MKGTHTWTRVAAQMGGSRVAETVRGGTDEPAACYALTDILTRKISQSAIYIKGKASWKKSIVQFRPECGSKCLLE